MLLIVCLQCRDLSGALTADRLHRIATPRECGSAQGTVAPSARKRLHSDLYVCPERCRARESLHRMQQGGPGGAAFVTPLLPLTQCIAKACPALHTLTLLPFVPSGALLEEATKCSRAVAGCLFVYTHLSQPICISYLAYLYIYIVQMYIYILFVHPTFQRGWKSPLAMSASIHA